MTEDLEVDPADPGSLTAAVEAAARALEQGNLVVFPTETVYGIACRPDDAAATARAFEAKRRPSGLNLPVLANSAESAWEVARPDRRARRLAEAFWPGPVTLILPRTERSRGWELGRRKESIAVRVPAHHLSSSILERAGPLATTSANLSGRPPLDRKEDLIAAFGEAVAVYIVLAAGATPPGGAPSTIVDLTEREMRMVRPGPVEIGRLTAEMGPI
ncbi:MAG: threonylcarbamoyl-AMP synthase [Actinobacteria bacterium]|nr:MAG: threonylcarbamoyl-AMP synthase [Actinomycetota bacterium]